MSKSNHGITLPGPDDFCRGAYARTGMPMRRCTIGHARRLGGGLQTPIGFSAAWRAALARRGWKPQIAPIVALNDELDGQTLSELFAEAMERVALE